MIAVANAVQHSEETLQSLQFGSRAMRVQTQAVVNECLDFKVTTSSVNNITVSAESQGSDGHLETCQQLQSMHSRCCGLHGRACRLEPPCLQARTVVPGHVPNCNALQVHMSGHGSVLHAELPLVQTCGLRVYTEPWQL